MLRRMYLKWSDNKDFKYQIVSEHKGDEAGIKSTTIKIVLKTNIFSTRLLIVLKVKLLQSTL